MIKSKDDISLQITVIRRYFAFLLLEQVRKTYKSANKGDSQAILNDSKNNLENKNQKKYAKVIEGDNKVIIYDRTALTKEIHKVNFDKKAHGISFFPLGCRQYFHNDRIYITGGKVNNENIKIVLCYIPKEQKLFRMADMNTARSYHCSIFHENLKAIIVLGGEENSSCEMYDFFINMWTIIPSLNVPRSNISVYIDKLGSFAYALCGITGKVTDGHYSDVIEFLDLIDMNQGWARVEYKNKAEVDLKDRENQFFPLREDKLLIYGANESRKYHRCYCIFDLKKFEITKLDQETLELFKAKLVMHPEDI